MRLRFFATIFSLLLSVVAVAQDVDFAPLGSRAYVSVFTCSPGTQLYSQFGHSAIGVFDPDQQKGVVFNYGTFSFNTPNFYLKFMSGKLNYRLSTETYSEFEGVYNRRGRRVTEQRLNLTQQQNQHLLDLLLENNKPENRYYQYDFFFDNCASRVLDMLYAALGDSLAHCDSLAEKVTYRQLIHRYLNDSKWTKFGIDIILGSVIDRYASARQQAFLPDKLMEYCELSSIDGKPLVRLNHNIVEETQTKTTTPWWCSPIAMLLVLLVFVVVANRFCPRANDIFDRIFFSTLALLGVLIALLWFATDHDATVLNVNILWASPVFFVYIWMLKRNRVQWIKRLHKFFAVCFAISLLCHVLAIQPINIETLIIMVIAAMRFYQQNELIKSGK